MRVEFFVNRAEGEALLREMQGVEKDLLGVLGDGPHESTEPAEVSLRLTRGLISVIQALSAPVE